VVTNASENVGRGPVDPPPSDTYDRGASTGPRPSSSRRRPKQDKQLPLWQEMLLLLGIALVLAIVIKAFFMQAFYIPSGSMKDTLRLDDRILVQKVSYWNGGPERGDIVVFGDPGGWLNQAEVRTADNAVSRTLELFGLYPTGGHLVKRVIGIGGDTVKCCDKQGRILVNGVPLNERAYLARGEQPSMIKFEVEVPEGFVWVQGDNRSNSADSRVHLGDPGGGFISEDRVVGKVFMVVWPWDHAQLLERPATFDAVGAK
jgi:signal peptidase I